MEPQKQSKRSKEVQILPTLHTHTHRHIIPFPLLSHRPVLHHGGRQAMVRHAPFHGRCQPPDEVNGQDGGGELVPARDSEAPLRDGPRLVEGENLSVVCACV